MSQNIKTAGQIAYETAEKANRFIFGMPILSWVDQAQTVRSAWERAAVENGDEVEWKRLRLTAWENRALNAEAALRRLHVAVRNLGRTGADRKTLFEGSPVNDPDCHSAWIELNEAQKQAASVLVTDSPSDNGIQKSVCHFCGHAPHPGRQCGAELPEGTPHGSHCHCQKSHTITGAVENSAATADFTVPEHS